MTSSANPRPSRPSALRALRSLLARLFRRRPRRPARRPALGLQQLESREVLSGYAPTGLEQEFLERLNDARANPAAYGVSIGFDLSGVAPSQPLAFNTSLVQSSRDHSIDMDVNNYFSHTGSDGSDPFQRMQAAGFPQVGAAESIAGGSGFMTPEEALAGLIVDFNTNPPGHRYQLLSMAAGGVPYTGEQQTGVGIVLNGTGAAQNYYTIDSGYTADTRPFLLGVVSNDSNHNGVYDNGEGLGGVVITMVGSGGTYQTVTWDSGGYSLQVNPGVYTVTASGGAMGAGVSRVVGVGALNTRLNFNPPIAPTVTALASATNPSYAGQAVTFTATVANAAAGGIAPPGGKVEFFDGTADLGFGSALAAKGNRATSTLTIAALAAGTHALRAVYEPVGSFSGSVGTLTQTVTPNHLAFVVPPGAAVAGQALDPAVQVAVVDQDGNVQSGDNSDQVTLKVASGPGAFAAGSTVTATVSGGVATFDNLMLDTAGAYALGAGGTGSLTGPTSAGFTVSPAAADHLVFASPPGNGTPGTAISPAVRVAEVDPFGNVETGDNSDQVMAAVASGPATFAADSTTTAIVSGGVASFSNLVLPTLGTYTLSATDTAGLTPATSGSLIVATFADNFNRAALGPSWAQESGATGIRGNQLAVVGGAPGLAVYRSAFMTDTGVQARIALGTAGTQYAGLAARFAGPGLANFYLGEVVGSNGKFTAYLFRNRGGAFTPLASAPAPGGSGTLRLEVVGSSLKLFLDGQLLTYAFDSTLSSGITGAWGSPGATMGNFAGGPIALTSVALPFADTFAQPDGSQLSRSWAERSGNFAVQTNQLRANDPGVSLATVNLAPAIADVAVQANVALSSTGTQYAGLVVRYGGAGAGSMYLGEVVGGNGAFTAYVLRYVRGRWTVLSSQKLTGGSGLLLFTVQGSHLQLSWNGVVECDLSDGAITAAGLAGLRAYRGALLSNFSVSAP